MKTHAFVHFETGRDAEKARFELNGVKITPKYATKKVSKPVRLCKYETKGALLEPRSGNTNLLVKNLSKEMSAHALWNTFRQFGDIVSCKLNFDLAGISKGFGFVSFYKSQDAENAIKELNDKEFNGKLMKVNLLQRGKRAELRKNNIYVKHFPKTFSDEDFKV